MIALWDFTCLKRNMHISVSIYYLVIRVYTCVCINVILLDKKICFIWPDLQYVHITKRNRNYIRWKYNSILLYSTRISWNCKVLEIEICFSICNICVTWKIFKISKKIYTSRKRRKTNVSWFWIGKQVVLKDLVYDVSALSTEKYEEHPKIIRYRFNK